MTPRNQPNGDPQPPVPPQPTPQPTPQPQPRPGEEPEVAAEPTDTPPADTVEDVSAADAAIESYRRNNPGDESVKE
jgi:hypothetical protein